MTDLFPGRLQSCRERRRISRRTLSELCGLSKNVVAMYERGERLPSLDVAVRLADLLDVSLDWLCGRSSS